MYILYNIIILSVQYLKKKLFLNQNKITDREKENAAAGGSSFVRGKRKS